MAVMFAAMAVVVLAIVGGAIDFLHAHARRSEFQSAMDSAVLAVAASTDPDRIDLGASTFDANVSGTHHRPRFEIRPDGSVLGTISAGVPTTLLNLLGISQIEVTVRSAAAAEAGSSTIELTFTPITAKGAFDKQIMLFVRDGSGTIVSLTPVLDYDYQGTGSPGPVALAGGHSSFTVTAVAGNTYGLMMRVWADDTLSGDRTVVPDDYYSDTATEHIRTIGDCETGQTNNWEDTGDNDYLDFVFDLTCTGGGGASASNVRLIE